MEMKEVCVYSREELSRLPNDAKEKVLILDFDDTLFSFNIADIPDDPSAQIPRYLIGGEQTRTKLHELFNAGVTLCIATNKNKEGADEAKQLLEKIGLSFYFDTIVYEKTADKADLLGACKSHYQNDQATTQFTFIDDNKRCRNSANQLGLTAIHPKTTCGNEPEENGRLLNKALTKAQQAFSQPQNQIEDNSATASSTAQSSNPDNTKTILKEQPKRFLYPVNWYSSNLLEWLVIAGFPNTLSMVMNLYLGKTHFESNIPLSTKLLHVISHPFSLLVTIVKVMFVKSIGFDGYNSVTNQITSADGETSEYNGPSISFWLMLASFLGLPSRPESVVNGVPQFSGWQLLRNFFGVWSPVKETLSNEDGSLSFYQKRWTEKKIVQALVLLVKILLIFPLKLVTMPFKLMLNIVKLVVEVLILPIISNIFLQLSLFTAGLTLKLASIAKEKGWRLTLALAIPILLLGALTVALTVIQYGIMLARRVSLALTSPEKSARMAFALGYRLTIGTKDSKLQKTISFVMGSLGFALSLTLTAVLWAITLPLALGALTTAIPSIFTAINWISQTSVVAGTLSWLTQFPLVISSISLVSGFFGTLGTALTAAFGPAITTLASVISIQIPATLMIVGTTLGLLAIPTAAMLSRAADALSNLWVKWVEQKPFATLAARLSSRKKDSTEYAELENVPLQIEEDANKSGVYVYQPESGKEYIVSSRPLYLARQNNALLENIHVTGKKAERLYQRANSNDENLLAAGARLASDKELRGTAEAPTIVSVG